MKKQFNLKDKEIISFVGAGGKTTTIEKLAIELKRDGKKVLWTTSTAILTPAKDKYDRIFIESIPQDYIPQVGSVAVFGEYEVDGKLFSKNTSLIDELIRRDIFDVCLIEADGSKKKPIKAPNEHEPVISNLTTITVGVIGLDCLGKRVDKIVHRPEVFMNLLNIKEDHLIDYNDIIGLAKHEKGLFKNSVGRKILLLNKVQNDQMDVANHISEQLVSEEIEVVVEEYVGNR